MSESTDIQQVHAILSGMADALNKALPEIGEKAVSRFGELLAKNMTQGSAIVPPDHRPGTSGALQMSSGRLAKSWMVNAGGNNDTQYMLTVNGGKLTVTFGSNVPYAAIQQYGGAITPTEKMKRFMLAMVIQTQGKDNFWVKMLGHVLHGQPIIIKPTNYLDAPLKKFTDDAPDFVKTLLAQKLIAKS